MGRLQHLCGAGQKPIAHPTAWRRTMTEQGSSCQALGGIFQGGCPTQNCLMKSGKFQMRKIYWSLWHAFNFSHTTASFSDELLIEQQEMSSQFKKNHITKHIQCKKIMINKGNNWTTANMPWGNKHQMVLRFIYMVELIKWMLKISSGESAVSFAIKSCFLLFLSGQRVLSLTGKQQACPELTGAG